MSLRTILALAAVTAGLAGGSDASASGFIPVAKNASRKGAPDLPPTRGPLRVSSRNPRYFEDRTGKIVYLTGSHTWTNLQDITGEDWMKPISEMGGYSAYLDRLARYPHNFFRLWIVEHAWDSHTGARISPHPWMRTGPDNARDGKPKFDLDRLNPEYFQRMRERIAEARKRGMYVGVMFFDDWSTENGGAWEGHPFHRDNNINGVDADLNRDGLGVEFHTLQDKRILAYQEAYVRRAMEAVNSFDNVLYEIANETTVLGSKEWQYHFIRFIKEAQAKKRMRHPVGMTVADTEVNNAALFASDAEWISPGTEGGYQDDPPAADGRKVIVSDTDHLWGVGGDADWVWKSFLRGLNPIYMDPMFEEAKHEAVRKAMGHTWRIAMKLNLAAMTPQPDLSSTRYCLADPGKAYLIYQPGKEPFSVRLPEGTYEAEWFDPEAEVTRMGERIKSAGGKETMTPPFAGRAVLSLKRAGRR
ncbi:MAG: DUF4038 domain-containing protein [Armatimonadetes bacterium]|nr:DUF4038 domain-containing protein [Armatimonadota bacterium]